MSQHAVDEKLERLDDEPDYFELFVETLAGNTFNIRVRPRDTVLDVKKKIQQVEGIPVNHQNLLFRLQELRDFNRVCDAGIANGSTLKLVLSMRGGPISTRRLLSCDHHLLLKDLKELIDNTREEFGDKLNSGLKVSVLIFREGDVINLIRVVENDEGIYNTLVKREQLLVGGGGSGSSVSAKATIDDGNQNYYKRIQENDAMSTKLAILRRNMSRVDTRRRLKRERCDESVDEKSKDAAADTGGSDPCSDKREEHFEPLSPLDRYELMEKFKKDTKSLLKLHESQFEDQDSGNEEEGCEHGKNNCDFENSLQICEDSIALKEKHRGKNNFYNVLFQNSHLGSEKPLKSQVLSSSAFPSSSFKSLRERNGHYYLRRDQSAVSALKSLRATSRSLINFATTTQDRRKSGDEALYSPFHDRFMSASGSGTSRFSPNHVGKFDTKVNLPDLGASTSSSLAESVAIVSEDVKDNDKELISPIGVVPFAATGTVSMSKAVTPSRESVCVTPLVLRETSDRQTAEPPESVTLVDDEPAKFCDICTRDSSPSAAAAASLRKHDIGILKRWHSVDYSPSSSPATSSPEVNTDPGCPSGGPDFDVVDREFFFPSLTTGQYASSSTASTETSANSRLFGGQIRRERISRFPLYRRFSTSDSTHQDKLVYGSGAPAVAESAPNVQLKRLDSKLVSSCREESADQDELNLEKTVEKPTSSKVNGLPAVITKKRLRCNACSKKLNITNMYDCRCGRIFCAQHRYSEVHGCNFDYKTYGRKLLERQNPLVVAEKLNKL